MKATHKSILLLGLSGFLAGSLFAGGDREDGERRGKRGSSGGMMIKMLDQDQDGMVSKVEMLSHFDKVDSNGDGLLSAEEFKTHRESQREEMKKKHEAFKDMSPEERFAKMDKNGNGIVEESEFPHKRAFEKIDADKSGGLSQAELEAFKAKMKDRGPKREKKGKREKDDA